ncbi:MAG: hypothetical protein BWY93_02157 [Euryarchaeota archaeon ADurb.BinA087]|nr:MAG: hypothetical protein BWY93_02157 [Euryarchaeota archaeon ADurb.BinA087]
MQLSSSLLSGSRFKLEASICSVTVTGSIACGSPSLYIGEPVSVADDASCTFSTGAGLTLPTTFAFSSVWIVLSDPGAYFMNLIGTPDLISSAILWQSASYSALSYWPMISSSVSIIPPCFLL